MCKLAQLNMEKLDGPAIRHTLRNCNINDTAVGPYNRKNRMHTCQEYSSYFNKTGLTYVQIEHAFTESDICDGFHYGVMLRDPFDLAVSAINFAQRNNNFTKQIECLKDGVPCGDTVTWKRMDNFHIRSLLSFEEHDLEPGLVTDDHADKVIARLERHFAVVTLLEEMHTHTKDILETALGWFVPFHSQANVSPHRHTFTPEQEAFIRHNIRHDTKVYNYFKSKLPQQRGLARQLD